MIKVYTILLILSITLPVIYFVTVLVALFIKWQEERFNTKVDRENKADIIINNAKVTGKIVKKL